MDIEVAVPERTTLSAGIFVKSALDGFINGLSMGFYVAFECGCHNLRILILDWLCP